MYERCYIFVMAYMSDLPACTIQANKVSCRVYISTGTTQNYCDLLGWMDVSMDNLQNPNLQFSSLALDFVHLWDDLQL